MMALYAAACCRMERRVARAVRIGGKVYSGIRLRNRVACWIGNFTHTLAFCQFVRRELTGRPKTRCVLHIQPNCCFQ